MERGAFLEFLILRQVGFVGAGWPGQVDAEVRTRSYNGGEEPM